ncbi:MAG: hypothetical protein ACXWWC_06700 [Chitinophagaceae bacterium]
MRHILSLQVLLLMCLFNYSCKKESEKKYCWQIVDHLGNEMGVVGEKTEAELLACVNNRTCGFSTTGALTACFITKQREGNFVGLSTIAI